MKTFFIFIFIIAVFFQLSAQSLTYIDLVARLTDLEHLAIAPRPGEKCSQWSSYERVSQYDTVANKYINWSSNSDGGGFIRMEGEEQVLAEMEGPGCIWRIWSARPETGHVKIYLDGLAEPVVDLPFSKYFDRSETPFIYPALIYTTARGQNCYLPIPYQKSCKIVAENGWGRYYHFTYSDFPKNTTVSTFKRHLSMNEKNALEKADRYLRDGLGTHPDGIREDDKKKRSTHNIKPGSLETIFTMPGAGAITAIRAHIDLPATLVEQRERLRKLTIRIFWDGEKNPAVWAPLGDFFGTAPGVNPYKSLPLGMDTEEFYCFWYMPFGKGARIEMLNEDTRACNITFTISYSALKRSISHYSRFHAKWHRNLLLPEDPEQEIDWTLLKTSGSGRYCGVMLHVWNPRGGWWGEGDEKFFVDGEKFPSTFGTGSEDYFGYAWCDPTLFSNAFHNQTISMENKGHISVNRWHIADNIPFQKSFEGYIEKYFPDKRPTAYSAMVYWYLEPNGIDLYIPDPAIQRTEYWITPPVDFIKDAIEGEELQVLSVTGGKTLIQDMDGRWPLFWSGQSHLYWTEGQIGDQLELAIPVKLSGKYALFAQFTNSPAAAIIQLYIDDTAIGDPIDCYGPVPPISSVKPMGMGSYEFDQKYGFFLRKHEKPSGLLYLGDIKLSKGDHVLRIKLVGKNPDSDGRNRVGLDYIKLVMPK